jgi:hypothetical protein
MTLLSNELNWFARVDGFRQNGFYCDYSEQLDKPLDINEEDYRNVYTRLEKVRKICEGFFEVFANADYKEDFEEKLLQFNRKETYDFIEDILDNLRQSEDGVFDIIKNKFETSIPNFLKEYDEYNKANTLVKKYSNPVIQDL